MPDFIFKIDNPYAEQIIQAYKEAGFETRYVGGCVRDSLLQRPVKDIDLATTALPQQSQDILQKHHIKVIPTGMAHGTVTAVIDQHSFEITTLRRDKDTDGRHATIEYSESWEEDAKRRDFTINALSANSNGEIFDYTDGLKDIEAKKLRFIGDAPLRIQEDYLRILRYFRFLSVLDWHDIDADALQACITYKSQLKSLSRERLHAELYKILLGAGAVRVAQLMSEHGILSDIIGDLNIDRFEHLMVLEQALNTADPLRRILALVGYDDIAVLEKFMVPTQRDKKRIGNLQKILKNNDWPTKKHLYFTGADAVFDHVFLNQDLEMLKELKEWRNPIFPILSDKVIEIAGGPGPKLGQLLKQGEDWWVEKDFQPDKDEILDYIKTIA